jgi:alkylation response protein AidB-like acyl-CoA dehydrogenase
MSQYKAPLRDIRFALYDLLGAEARFRELGFDDAGRDTVDAVLDESARFCETVLAPLNAVGDEQGVRHDKASGDVATPTGFKQAYAQFAEGGWGGLGAPVEYGGLGLPHVLGMPLEEMIDAANLAWGNFPLLSHGAANALRLHGEEWQREVFLTRLVSGEWTGTMCLTEPHCGTDLGLLKTRAEPDDDGTHSITGTKIFITAGEHDLTPNIVHLVLARLPDAPAGSKGISLFLVPKFKVARDGSMGERNALQCGAVEHKMGIHGSATCVMNFDGAQGWLIGQPHKGLMAMFTMMNTARLGVGLQGLGLADRAYQNALRYARERLQSRALSGPKLPEKPAEIRTPFMINIRLFKKSSSEAAADDPDAEFKVFPHSGEPVAPRFFIHLPGDTHVETAGMKSPDMIFTAAYPPGCQRRRHGITDGFLQRRKVRMAAIRPAPCIHRIPGQRHAYGFKIAGGNDTIRIKYNKKITFGTLKPVIPAESLSAVFFTVIVNVQFIPEFLYLVSARQHGTVFHNNDFKMGVSLMS